MSAVATETRPQAPATPPPTRPNAFPGIGLLRLLLATMVVFSHSYYLGGVGREPGLGQLFNNQDFFGGVAVKAFFVISGFLVFRSERRLNNTHCFLWHRFLRIMPGLWMCLLLTAFIIAPLIAQHGGTWSFRESLDYVWRNSVMPRSQLSIAGLPVHTARTGDLNGSLWSLEYEFGCYIALAFIGWIGLPRFLGAKAWWLGGAVLCIFLHDHVHPQHALFFKSYGRDMVAYFACGASASALDVSWNAWPPFHAMAVLATIAFFLAYHITGLAVLSPAFLTTIILWLATRNWLPDFERLVGGDYSYGLYIYAYPIQQWLASCEVQRSGPVAFFLASLAVAGAIAVLSWHLVEKTALRAKALVPLHR